MTDRRIIHTEVQAAKIRCCVSGCGRLENLGTEMEPDMGYACVGPACMGWRWWTYMARPAPGLEFSPLPSGAGYCGRAGQPELPTRSVE